MSETILLTGSTGLVGTALVPKLRERFPEAQIRATFRNTPPQQNHPSVDYQRVDLMDPQQCQQAAQGVSLAVLAAAESGGAAANVSSPGHFLTQNLILNARLIEALALAGTRRLLFLGSATVYSDSAQAIREQDLDWNREPPQAFFGVGWAMRASEKIARFWHQEKGMEVGVLRLANIYGPYCRFQPGSSNFIPALIRKGTERLDPFEVWGRPDVVRDVLYVDDCARAVADLLAQPDWRWLELNLGSGQPVTVDQVVSEVLLACQHAPRELVYRSDAPTTMPFRLLDVERIRRQLDWAPLIGLREGIARTARWWKDHQLDWLR